MDSDETQRSDGCRLLNNTMTMIYNDRFGNRLEQFRRQYEVYGSDACATITLLASFQVKNKYSKYTSIITSCSTLDCLLCIQHTPTTSIRLLQIPNPDVNINKNTKTPKHPDSNPRPSRHTQQ